MKLLYKIMIAVIAWAGLAQVVMPAQKGYPKKQKVRAYKEPSADKNKLWTMYIQEMQPNAGLDYTVRSIVEFKENTDNVPKHQRIKGYPPHFYFKDEKAFNKIKVYTVSSGSPDYNIDTSPHLKELLVSPKDVPLGSQIRLSDSKIEIDRSKVKESISVTNNFDKDVRIEVFFLENQNAKTQKPIKKTMTVGQKVVIKQPTNKKYVQIFVYKSNTPNKIPLFEAGRAVDLDRNFSIGGSGDKATLSLNGKEIPTETWQ